MKPDQTKLIVGGVVVVVVVVTLSLWLSRTLRPNIKLRLKGSKLCIIKSDNCYHCRQMNWFKSYRLCQASATSLSYCGQPTNSC